ncbi:MAG: hypothetical protein IPK64_21810 [bacterium]|nr:hypothetical protein [bacterium]
MKARFAGQVAKEPSDPGAGEDAYRLAIEIGLAALSDGASESFDSKTWANRLVDGFVRDPALTADWLDRAVTDYRGHHDRGRMSWSRQAAFDRGSFATLLGVEQCVERETVDIVCVGDSLAVLLDGNERVASFPYERAAEFQRRPELFGTDGALNDFFNAPDFFIRHHRTWRYSDRERPVVLCMTDALGEWALRREEEGRPVWERLAGIARAADFEALVLDERRTKALRVDDTTLITLVLVERCERELPDARAI